MLVQNAGASHRKAAPSSSAREFVCAMEDFQNLFHRQYGDNEVLVCLDETSKQQSLPSATTGGERDGLPRPARPGAAGSYDYEYQRKAVSNLFMLFAPLEGWRRVAVTDRRTKADWARVVKQPVDEDYPDQDRIVLVMDNPVSSAGQALNTPQPRLSPYVEKSRVPLAAKWRDARIRG